MYKAFTSLPDDEEQQFVVFEQRTRESARRAQLLGWCFGGGLIALLVAIILGFWAPLKPYNNGEAPETTAPAAHAPTAAPAPAPSPAPAEAPAPVPAPAAGTPAPAPAAGSPPAPAPATPPAK